MELKVLGSVSPYSKGDKNGVSNLIIDGDYKILLDCGPGSTRLLNMEQDLNNLIVIISHLHKDHYADLLALGYASYVYHNLGYLKEKVKVFIPKGDRKENPETYYYKDYGEHKVTFSNLEDYDYLMNFGKENYLEFIPYSDEEKLSFGNMKVQFKLNKHNLRTNAAKITLINNSASLVYSADTGFNGNNLSEFANNADLFVCESTFLKGQNKNGDNHLYAYEAGLIAKEAGVKKLILTHFWPEIDKQKYVDEAEDIFRNAHAAEEGKVYKIGGK